MKKHQEEAVILDNIPIIGQDTYRLILQAPMIAREARPGQFVMVRVDKSYDPFLRRPFSFFRIDKEEGIIEIGYKVVGRGTTLLSQKKRGQTVDLLGPLGNGFRLPPEDTSDIWVIAGGVGITALIPCLEDLRIKRPKAKRVLFYGVKTASELIPSSFFKSLCHEVLYSTDDGTMGFRGVITECIDYHVQKGEKLPSVIYACGPLIMLKHIARWALAHSIPGQFCLESIMGCGLGACLGCAVPGNIRHGNSEKGYVHVCFEGPVFPVENIRWDEL
ncbi:MAG: dihydroorotate dehydrogenase electron transfer subunit [Deltaproteobacteria bacterium]|nr:dihydroorotate dehydrogenase electron transfer subunit [Deltaproteobacteria bacterium]MBW2067378.1 dihydroorotate dehydrogenase electron transfer subunit [Deltaproteobacteria bacterium]